MPAAREPIGPNTKRDITDDSSERSCAFAVDNNSTAAQPPSAARMKPAMAASMTCKKRGIVLSACELWECGCAA
jgi:hypothetical protein